MSKSLNVALLGNPNTGKTSVFNQLTGLNQKVGETIQELLSKKKKGSVSLIIPQKHMS